MNSIIWMLYIGYYKENDELTCERMFDKILARITYRHICRIETNICILVDTIQLEGGVIYIGEIKNILVDEKIKDITYGKIDLINVDPLIYAPGGYYNLGKRVGNVGESKDKF